MHFTTVDNARAGCPRPPLPSPTTAAAPVGDAPVAVVSLPPPAHGRCRRRDGRARISPDHAGGHLVRLGLRAEPLGRVERRHLGGGRRSGLVVPGAAGRCAPAIAGGAPRCLARVAAPWGEATGTIAARARIATSARVTASRRLRGHAAPARASRRRRQLATASPLTARVVVHGAPRRLALVAGRAPPSTTRVVHRTSAVDTVPGAATATGRRRTPPATFAAATRVVFGRTSHRTPSTSRSGGRNRPLAGRATPLGRPAPTGAFAARRAARPRLRLRRALAGPVLRRRLRIALAIDPHHTDHQRARRRDRHGREAVDQRCADRECLRQRVAVLRQPGHEQHHTRNRDPQDQRRLHHRPEQAPALHRADRADRPDEVRALEQPGQRLLRLHVDDRTDHRQPDREEHGAPPRQAPAFTGDGTLIPRHRDVVGVGIAPAIGNGGHRATP